MALLARFATEAGHAVDLDDSGGGGSSLTTRSIVGASCVRCVAKALAVARVRLQPVCAPCLVSGGFKRVVQFYHDSPAHGYSIMVSLNGPASRVLGSLTRRVMDTGRKRRLFSDAAAVFIDYGSISALFTAGNGDGISNTAQSVLHSTLIEAARDGTNTIVIPVEALLVPAALDGNCRPCLHSIVMQAPVVTDSGLAKPRDILDSGARSIDDPAAAEAVEKAVVSLQDLRARPELVAAAESLREIFGSIESVDARQDLLVAITHRLSVTAALRAGYPFLASSETADSMALRVIAGICKGKGFGLPVDTLPTDYRYARGTPWTGASTEVSLVMPPSPWYPALLHTHVATAPAPGTGVVLLRPLMEAEDVELTHTARLLGLVVPPTLSFTASAPARASIEGTVAGVLAGLQRSYASTVHNVVRTARKLQLPAGAPRSFEDEAAAAAVAEDAREMREAIQEVEDEEGEDEEADGVGDVVPSSNVGALIVGESSTAPGLEQEPDRPPPLCPLCGAFVRERKEGEPPVLRAMAEQPSWLTLLLPTGVAAQSPLCHGCAKIR